MRRGKGRGGGFQRDESAVSPVMASMLMVTIVIMISAGIVAWGIPQLTELQAQAQYRATLGYMEALDSDLEDLTHEEENSTRLTKFSTTSGDFAVHAISEVWLIYYSTTALETYTMSLALDTRTITVTPSAGVVSSATIRLEWLSGPDAGHVKVETKSLAIPQPIVFDRDPDGKGSVVRGRIHDGDQHDRLMAEFFVFSLGNIQHTISVSESPYFIQYENGGIGTTYPFGKHIVNAPQMIPKDTALSLYMIHTHAQGGGGLERTGGTFDVVSRLARRELFIAPFARNVRLQVYRPYHGLRVSNDFTAAWSNFFKSDFEYWVHNLHQSPNAFVGFRSVQGAENNPEVTYQPGKRALDPASEGIPVKIIWCDIEVVVE